MVTPNGGKGSPMSDKINIYAVYDTDWDDVDDVFKSFDDAKDACDKLNGPLLDRWVPVEYAPVEDPQ